MKEGVYSRGIRPGSRNAAPGDATGGPDDQEATGGLGESVGAPAKGGGTGVAKGVGGGTVGTRVGGRHRATLTVKQFSNSVRVTCEIEAKPRLTQNTEVPDL